jgi:hypothetical protein
MERAVRLAAVMLILGLIVEGLSLCWNTAASFLSFMIFGGILFVGGVLIYVYSVFASQPATAPTKPRP